MRPMNMKNAISKTQLFLALMMAVALLLSAPAYAAAPGITGTSGTNGPTFYLTAQDAYITQPDGQSIYSWGYGCDPNQSKPGFLPTAIASPFCNSMQVPGPTLIVHEGDTVTVNLTNGLPAAAGNTSILFPGFQVCYGTLSGGVCTASGGVPGLMTQEAAPGGTVTYSFVATSPGTRSYYSGTQGDLQVEMGLYGAIIVLPASVPPVCDNSNSNLYGRPNYASVNLIGTEQDFRLSHAAYDHARTCYDREYLFQFSEMDPSIHRQAEAQTGRTCPAGAANTGCMEVATEPYHPNYFMINGRSMPDDMDPNYSPAYPHQPYNGNPHMHPGELTLIRVIGQGRWQHPFHEHGNHVRILARDGNLILTPDGTQLAGLMQFTTDTTPGQAFDGIFYFTAKGLNWDAYGHHPGDTSDPLGSLSCTPDVNGYNTGDTTALNYYEWCQDHNKPVQVAPFGDVASGGPATLPDPNIFTNGPWYGGSPYLGPDATTRAVGPTGTTPPSGTIANSPTGEAGWAFMWHSHNEREITTNNIFPGGMLMMMLVDSREFVIDESN
jgi:FtsP/CotA-like multicopper oxidase with cupredoxin domain